MRFTSTCSNAARALRYIRGKAITAAAITQPFHVCTTLKSKFSSRKLPKGLLQTEDQQQKKACHCRRKYQRHRKNTIQVTALDTGFSFMIFLAQKIPEKKRSTVATTPVFKEIHRGLQLISCRNSHSFISIL